VLDWYNFLLLKPEVYFYVNLNLEMSYLYFELQR
jgi:hypothetical protein